MITKDKGLLDVEVSISVLKGKKGKIAGSVGIIRDITRLKNNGAIVLDDPVVLDDRIISCNGPGSALEVAFLLMKCLMGSKTTQEVRKFMMYE